MINVNPLVHRILFFKAFLPLHSIQVLGPIMVEGPEGRLMPNNNQYRRLFSGFQEREVVVHALQDAIGRGIYQQILTLIA